VSDDRSKHWSDEGLVIVHRSDFDAAEHLREPGAEVEKAVTSWHTVTAEEGGAMPEPKEGESEQEFVSRCVPEVMGEGSTQEQALGKCYGIFRNANKSLGTVDTMAEGSTDKGLDAKGRIGLGSVQDEEGGMARARKDHAGEREMTDTDVAVTIPKQRKKIVPGSAGRPQVANPIEEQPASWEPIRQADFIRAARRAAKVIQRCLVFAASVKVAKSTAVDGSQLYGGTMEELEHTDDWQEAMQIALDHLSEDGRYYEKLDRAGMMKARKDLMGRPAQRGGKPGAPVAAADPNLQAANVAAACKVCTGNEDLLRSKQVQKCPVCGKDLAVMPGSMGQ